MGVLMTYELPELPELRRHMTAAAYEAFVKSVVDPEELGYGEDGLPRSELKKKMATTPTPAPHLSREARAHLGTSRALLSALRELRPTTSAGAAEAFLLVCLYEGASLTDLCRISGQPQSTMSRNLLDLGPRARNEQPGLGLVRWRHPIEELRRKEYFLTARGRALRDRVLMKEVLMGDEG